MRQIDYEELNPGIRRLVKMLRDAGFETTDSGDGKTNVEAGMEGALTVPHVHCIVSSKTMVQEAHRMLLLITDANLDIGPGTVQALFDPTDGVAMVSVYGIDDSVLAGAEDQEAQSYVKDLIKQSVQRDCIVHGTFTSARHGALVALAEGTVAVNGRHHDYWGTDDGREWRVYLDFKNNATVST